VIFPPVILLFIMAYFIGIGGIFLLVKVGLITLAFEKLGAPSDAVVAFVRIFRDIR